jgi:hypothetical protein
MKSGGADDWNINGGIYNQMDGTEVNLTLVPRIYGEKFVPRLAQSGQGYPCQDSRGGTVMTAERGGMDGVRVGKGSGAEEVWIRIELVRIN